MREKSLHITYLPAAHALQADDVDDPMTALYLPAIQEVHELCAVVAWYLRQESVCRHVVD